MSLSFPRAVWACIAEGRIPFHAEIEAVTDKVLRETFGGRSGSSEQGVAMRIAEVALFGARMSTT